MTTTRLNVVSQGIVTKAKATPMAGLPGGLLFGADGDRVFQVGDVIDMTRLPILLIDFDDQDTDEGETTTKITSRLPWIATVFFDKASTGDSGQKIHLTQDQIFEALYRRFMATDGDRAIDGEAIETSFLGGGSRLDPADVDDPVATWSIQLRFATTFRHRVADPKVQA